jgi:hypothetical protein
MATEKLLFRKIIKREQTHKPQITPRVVATRGGEGSTTQITSAAHQPASLGTPRANFRLARGPGAAPRNLCLARGADAPSGKSLPRSRGGRPSGESPPRSRAPRPLGRISASLEGRTAPRANLRLTGGPRAPSGESLPRSRAPRPLGRISASLEGLAPPRANLRLARGDDAPSRNSLLRSRPTRARDTCAHSPDQSIKCSDMPRVPGSNANPRHAGPLTPPGNHISAPFHQPSP